MINEINENIFNIKTVIYIKKLHLKFENKIVKKTKFNILIMYYNNNYYYF